ncbi:MAG: hypothetical protein ABJO01_09050 [Parasphingorhabdus sp.]|uniref:hypothetical protein n=1 Tax=Parasphingorhabdus sp. TaxID=2709688 RepID=UPI003296B4A6
MFLSKKAAVLVAVFLLPIFFSSPLEAAEDIKDTPERFSVLITYGEDACPEATSDDEIVVCAQRPETERYRIPKELREAEKDAVVSHSWTSTVALHDQINRADRPNGCSVNGSNGFTGCQSAFIRRWFEERREIED